MLAFSTHHITYRLCAYLIMNVLYFNVYGYTPLFFQGEEKMSVRYFEDSLIFQEADSAITVHQKLIDQRLSVGDTLVAIEALNRLASLYVNRVNYAKSYDAYWRALLLADKINHASSKAASYNGLAILYSLYERREAALSYYLLSLEINRALVAAQLVDSVVLRENYFPIAVHYKYEDNVDLANAYLDSCEMIYSERTENNLFIKAERAHTLLLTDQFTQADSIFGAIGPLIKRSHPEYQVILYSYIGDLYYAWNKPEASKQSYLQSIQFAFQYKNHLNFVPDVYLKLSNVFTELKDFKSANTYLNQAREIDESLYSSRSKNNKYLLEIKDDFRLEKERNMQLAKDKKLLGLQKNQQISNLKIYLLIISIVFLLSAGFFIFKYWRAKHKAEKKRLKNEKELEAQQAKEIIRIKNQELTGSTLQIIAKEELLSDLKDDLTTLYKQNPSKSIHKLIKDININNDQSWLDFEKRFTAVNNDFYHNLKTRFPTLKPYDLKVCALIKLDFSGKEMARLLGISPESANTARYRMRKKLSLNKNDNLVAFMQKI